MTELIFRRVRDFALAAAVVVAAWAAPATAQDATQGACGQGIVNFFTAVNAEPVEDTQGMVRASLAMDQAMAARDLGAWVTCLDSVTTAFFEIGHVDQSREIAAVATTARENACNAVLGGVLGVLHRETLEDMQGITRAGEAIARGNAARRAGDWNGCMAEGRAAFEAIGYYEAAAAAVVR